jgi:hypothetical protein
MDQSRRKGWWKSWWPFKHKFKHKQIDKSRIWKSWLKSHYQYNVSETKWSQLAPKKFRRKASKELQRQSKARYFCPIENENSMNCNSYTNSYQKEKGPFLPYGKQKDYKAMKNKEKWKKNCRYDLLLQKYINYENSEDLYISELPLQVNRDREILDSYHFHTQKPQPLHVLMDIDLSSYLRKEYHRNRGNREKKYFNCKMFHLGIDMDTWTNLDNDTEIRENGKKGTKENGNSDQEWDNQNLLSPSPEIHRIHQEISRFYQGKEIQPFQSFLKRNLFDWMGMNHEKFYLYRPIANSKSRFFPELGILDDTYHAYQTNPWIIPIQFLFDEHSELDKQNQEEKQQPSEVNLGFDLQEQEQKEQDRKTDSTESEIPEEKTNILEVTWKDLDFAEGLVGELGEWILLTQRYSLAQIKPLDPTFIPESTKNIRLICHLLRLEQDDPRFNRIALSALRKNEIHTGKIREDEDVKQNDKPLVQRLMLGREKLDIEPIRAFMNWDKTWIMYQIISLSLLDKNKHQMNEKFIKEKYVHKKDLDKSIDSNIFGNENNNDYDFLFLVPEHILSTRHRRKLRILMCFHSWSQNVENGISNENDVKNCKKFRNEDEYTINEDESTDTNPLRKFKSFLWPNYRLEDLACMNRYWFHTNNGSRFTMLRIHMYPQSQID